jgi:hypothetical protein
MNSVFFGFRTRLLNYCMTVLLKAVGACATSQNNYESVNHIFYAEQKSHKHSLAHTIMTVTELLRNDSNMKQFYRYHRPFKQLIVQLYKKYGAKSQYSRLDPGISYALNHLMRVLYINNTKQQQQIEEAMTNSQKSKQPSDADEKPQTQPQTQPRICSNPTCKNEETQFKRFRECSSCAGKVAYCSSKCRKTHFDYHRQNECGRFTDALHKYNRVYDSTSSSSSGNSFNGIKRDNNNSNNIFAKETLGMNDYSELKPLDSYHSLSKTKRLSKFASMNENQRRNSLTMRFSNKNLNNYFDLQSNENNTNKNTLAKYTHSMKEIKANESSGRRLSCLENNEIKKKLMSDNAASKTSSTNNKNESSTINFMKPLKTSTAVCLTDLTRKQISTGNLQQHQQPQQSSKQNSDSSSSSSSTTSKSAESNSSAKQQIPTTKKFKTSTGKAKTKARDDQYTHPMSDSSLKRRHSTASAIMTTLTKTTTTTLTKMKTKYCEADSTTSNKSPSKAYKCSKEFFYYGQAQYDFGSHKESRRNEEEQDEVNNDHQQDSEEDDDGDDDDDDEENEEDYLDSTSSDQTVEKEPDENNRNENDEVDEEQEEDDDEEEEIEEKRLAINENNRLRKFDDFYSSVNSDEPEYNSRYKIVREYEKYTALSANENVSSTSSSKVQSMSNTNDISSKHQSGLRAPQLSIATLSYNESSNKESNQHMLSDENDHDERTIDNDKNKHNPSDEDEEEDYEDDEDENLYAKVKQNVNLVIVNSMNSHVLTNSYNFTSIQDDLKAKAKSRETKKSSLFKETAVKNAKKANIKFNELKVFNNLENQSINSMRSELKSANTYELPKNSTPIFTDSRATAVLMRNHNHLYNAKLNLTIVPSQHQSQQQTNYTNNNNDERKPTFLLPKVPTCPGKFNSMGSLKPTEQFVTSTLKPVSEEVINVNTNNFRIKGSQLNVSQLTSIENVVSTDLVSVSKTPLPKDIRQTFKQEMKRDKIRCLIQ